METKDQVEQQPTATTTTTVVETATNDAAQPTTTDAPTVDAPTTTAATEDKKTEAAAEVKQEVAKPTDNQKDKVKAPPKVSASCGGCFSFLSKKRKNVEEVTETPKESKEAVKVNEPEPVVADEKVNNQPSDKPVEEVKSADATTTSEATEEKPAVVEEASDKPKVEEPATAAAPVEEKKENETKPTEAATEANSGWTSWFGFGGSKPAEQPKEVPPLPTPADDAKVEEKAEVDKANESKVTETPAATDAVKGEAEVTKDGETATKKDEDIAKAAEQPVVEQDGKKKETSKVDFLTRLRSVFRITKKKVTETTTANTNAADDMVKKEEAPVAEAKTPTATDESVKVEVANITSNPEAGEVASNSAPVQATTEEAKTEVKAEESKPAEPIKKETSKPTLIEKIRSSFKSTSPKKGQEPKAQAEEPAKAAENPAAEKVETEKKEEAIAEVREEKPKEEEVIKAPEENALVAT